MPTRFSQVLRALRHAGATARPHGRIGRLLHGATGALLVYNFFVNGETRNALFDPAAMRSELVFGVALGLLFLLRWAWMRRQGHSRLPADAPAWEQRLSRWAHRAIYGLLAYVVLSGVAIAGLRPGAVIDPEAVFFASDQPLLNFVLDTHAAAANLLLLLILMHVLAALWHLFVRRDGVWQSMIGRWPWRG
ncbi:cytochrome b [Lysobacter sp. CA196]|uniref:cytochrome b n=1 Tax=Lysobacter sp. CA196 TaxID=3455606 RepID=UPI003F8D8B14